MPIATSFVSVAGPTLVGLILTTLGVTAKNSSTFSTLCSNIWHTANVKAEQAKWAAIAYSAKSVNKLTDAILLKDKDNTQKTYVPAGFSQEVINSAIAYGALNTTSANATYGVTVSNIPDIINKQITFPIHVVEVGVGDFVGINNNGWKLRSKTSNQKVYGVFWKSIGGQYADGTVDFCLFSKSPFTAYEVVNGVQQPLPSEHPEWVYDSTNLTFSYGGRSYGYSKKDGGYPTKNVTSISHSVQINNFKEDDSSLVSAPANSFPIGYLYGNYANASGTLKVQTSGIPFYPITESISGMIDPTLTSNIPRWSDYVSGIQDVTVTDVNTGAISSSQAIPLTITGSSVKDIEQTGIYTGTGEIDAVTDIPYETVREGTTAVDIVNQVTTRYTANLSGNGQPMDISIYTNIWEFDLGYGLEYLAKIFDFLWSDNFVSNMVKAYQNPADCVISLTAWPFRPKAGSALEKIYFGNVDSQISWYRLKNQFELFDLGTIDIYDDLYKYGKIQPIQLDPYSKLTVFLPYIGEVTIPFTYAIYYKLRLKYRVDWISGACTAIMDGESRDTGEYRNKVGQWSGNCCIQLPFGGASFANMYRGLITGISSMAGLALGGPAGMAVGAGVGSAAGGILLPSGSQTSLQTSGNSAGAGGFLGAGQPYLTYYSPNISASAYSKHCAINGYPTNEVQPISIATGVCQIDSVHLDSLNATKTEKEMLERILKEGFQVDR